VVNADGTVDYTHDGSETIADSFTYTIRDATGAVSNTATVSLTITTQDDNPALGNNALTISEGGTVVLTGADLSATDAETAASALQFTVSGISGGQFESIASPGVAITTFSQQRIADGEIQFVHDGGEAAPTYSITVSDGALTDGPLAAIISFSNVNDAPTAVADASTALEGGTINIDLAVNDTDPDDGLDLTSIQIVSGPSNGSLVVNADGTVDYTHDGSETIADSFTYTIRDAAGAVSNTATVTLTITPQGDNPVLGNNALTISEGGSVVLSGADLSASDAETAASALQFTVTGVSGGQFEAVASPGVSITTFSQQQITDGEIQFVHDGGELSPTYSITVSDGALTDGPLAATISFTNVNDAPSAVADADTALEGGTITIDLAANDSDPDRVRSSQRLVAGQPRWDRRLHP
jgi:VCBS repeat-containing protein